MNKLVKIIYPFEIYDPCGVSYGPQTHYTLVMLPLFLIIILFRSEDPTQAIRGIVSKLF